MRRYSARFPAVLGLILLPVFLFAQQTLDSQAENVPPKFALVIGNGAYTNLAVLANPVNDATDMAEALTGLGFTVDKVLDGSLDQMSKAVTQLKNRLSVSKNSYGFFYYAGHGVQSNGENYLVPVDARIPDESFLRSRTKAVQDILDELNNAGNSLNVVVLDACRDNPFGWSRGGSRGLTFIDFLPANSIIVYATSAGQTAKDGSGRNGLFTSQLLPNLITPGLEVNEIFRRTMGDVMRVSGNMQCPAIYNQFPGLAYFSPPPPVSGAAAPVVTTAPAAEPAAAQETPSAITNEPTPLPPPAIASEPAPLPPPAITSEPTPLPPPAITSEPAPLPPPAQRPIPQPIPQPAPRPIAPSNGPKSAAELNATRLNTIGVSMGSAFSTPQVIATLRATIAPTNYTFLELGVDLGLLSSYTNSGYYSLYPYAQYNLFLPFSGWGKGGVYAGAGAGYMYAVYSFAKNSLEYNYLAGDKATFNVVSRNFVVGFNIADIVDISYTIRFNSQTMNSRVSAGYTFRFR